MALPRTFLCDAGDRCQLAWRRPGYVRRWQRRFEPQQKQLFGGCYLTRPVVELREGAGFTITEVDRFSDDSTQKILGATSLGIARSP